MKPEYERAVALASGVAEAVTDDEREKLRRGDALLKAVVKHGITMNGKPIVDRWPGREPPNYEPVEGLLPRQQVTAALLLQGKSVHEIAAELAITTHQVRHEMKGLRAKTGERYTWRAALLAALWGWL
jgi:DNA-binding NarL/FixJ family response regulator